MEESELVAALQSAILSVPAFAEGISLGEDGQLVYERVGYSANLNNIAVSIEEEEKILWALISHAFDLPKGESIKIIYKPVERGCVMYLCMHHIIGDANSLILLLRQILTGALGTLEAVPTESETVQLDPQAQYLLKAIDKQYPEIKNYTRQEYLSMHERAFAVGKPEIRQILLQEEELISLKNHSKEQGISLTAYMVAELLKNRDLDMVCLPVDTRSSSDLFGNYVGRIDIGRKSLVKQENIPRAIQQTIQNALQDKTGQARSEQLLSGIPPQFYDDVIFDVYGDRPKPSVRPMAKLIGYKDPRPTTFLSNLKEVCLQAEYVSNLCFYPPHPAERYATIGVVTYKNQMVITVQKFRKDGCNE